MNGQFNLFRPFPHTLVPHTSLALALVLNQSSSFVILRSSSLLLNNLLNPLIGPMSPPPRLINRRTGKLIRRRTKKSEWMKRGKGGNGGWANNVNNARGGHLVMVVLPSNYLYTVNFWREREGRREGEWEHPLSPPLMLEWNGCMHALKDWGLLFRQMLHEFGDELMGVLQATLILINPFPFPPLLLPFIKPKKKEKKFFLVHYSIYYCWRSLLVEFLNFFVLYSKSIANFIASSAVLDCTLQKLFFPWICFLMPTWFIQNKGSISHSWNLRSLIHTKNITTF